MVGCLVDLIYICVENLIVVVFESFVVDVENGEMVVGFVFGMVVILLIVFVFVWLGDCIVCVEYVYLDVYWLFEWLFRFFGVDIIYYLVEVFENDLDLLVGVKFVYLESLNIMVFQVLDLVCVLGYVRRYSMFMVIDNFWVILVFQ